jgi:hypothetical protein
MPKAGSVNQMEPSDLTTTSFGELRGLPSTPSKRLQMTVIDPPHAVLAGHEPALPVAGIAVGIVRRLAEDAHRTGFLLPFQDAVVGDVAPQQRAEFAEPDRALAPAAAGIELLDRRVHRRFDRVETRIERDNCGIGIGLGGLPTGGHRGSP